MERIGRLFIGAGFAWMFVVLVVGILGGLDKPSAWIAYLDSVAGNRVISDIYRALAVIVVPIGLLALMWDIFRDPVALWVKVAAPGAFLAIYGLFLLSAMPDVGRPLFTWVDASIAQVAPLQRLSQSPDATGHWLIRFGTVFAFLAGIPGAIVALVSLVTGVGRGTRRS